LTNATAVREARSRKGPGRGVASALSTWFTLPGITTRRLEAHYLAGGNVVLDQPRHVVLRDTLNHLAHHRGQLTVYLRLTDQTVPAIYGPSADDQRFA